MPPARYARGHPHACRRADSRVSCIGSAHAYACHLGCRGELSVTLRRLLELDAHQRGKAVPLPPLHRSVHRSGQLAHEESEPPLLCERASIKDLREQDAGPKAPRDRAQPIWNPDPANFLCRSALGAARIGCPL
eukprot:CAMPEP_0180021798 /NCGR_PEP_ID=MMETSP0984-20121128/22523_1 /TAXON_ID=483367 /ORGANISM="non described non described, Strain CCMP 2436" /LENGTH=133 /DNA_ID=CAMNT_0021945805 /DNA_START=290 /DNA_END=688 /DNA_ORIENTATION=-